MIKSFYIAADAVLSGADILQNVVGGNILRIDDASDIQRVNDIIEFQTVDFGNQLGIGNTLCKECKENILLIQIGQGDKGFRFCQSLFKKERTICSVTIDDSCVWKQFA